MQAGARVLLVSWLLLGGLAAPPGAGAREPGAWLAAIGERLDGGDARGALELAEQAMQEHRDHPALLLVTARIELARGDALGSAGKLKEGYRAHRRALNLILRAEEIDAAAVPAWAHLGAGYVLAGQGELDGALGHLEASIRLDPRHPEAFFRRARIRRQQGRREDAVADLRRALELEPGRTEYALSLADLLAHQGRLRDAIAALQKALGAAPRREASLESARRYSLLLAIHRHALDLLDFDACRAALEEALRLQPGDPPASLELGVLLYREERFEEADRTLAETLRGGGSLPAAARAEALYRRGLIARHERRDAEARDLLVAATELDPEKAGAWQALVSVDVALDREKDAVRARERFRTALAIGRVREELRSALVRGQPMLAAYEAAIGRLEKLGAASAVASLVAELEREMPDHPRVEALRSSLASATGAGSAR